MDTETRILVRVGNTAPPLEVDVTDELGRAVDLTGSRVEVVVTDWQGAELWRADATSVAADAVTYDWRPADVAQAGNYGLYLHVTRPDASTWDFPPSGPFDLTVAEQPADADPYVVDVDAVARRVGIPESERTDDVRAFLKDVIADVQADVEGYLGRPVVPTRFTELAAFTPTDPTNWALAYDPVIKVLSASDTPDSNGLFTVSYVAGITNPIALRAIARYVTGASVEEFRAHPSYGKKYRAVRSLSAGGQSITYADPAGTNRRSSAQLPSYPQPGAMPSIETLARWRRRGVFSRPRYVGPGDQSVQGPFGAGVYSYGADGAADPLFVGDARTGQVFPR